MGSMESKLSQQQLRAYAKLSLDELDKFCKHTAARSSGAGGQSVNTADSKVLSRFIPDSTIKAVSQRERSQYQNRRANLKKIHLKLLDLSCPEKERFDTQPTRSSQIRRVDEKKKKGALKKSRSHDFDEE